MVCTSFAIEGLVASTQADRHNNHMVECIASSLADGMIAWSVDLDLVHSRIPLVA